MRRILLLLSLSIGLVFSGWSQITTAEYFIDTDPGVGNATTLTLTAGNSIDENFSIPTTGLSTGLHVLHIRVKGTNNVWSLYYRDYFYIHTIESPPTAKNIVEAEYFVDSDPGVGNGTALTITSGMMVDETFNIPTTGLSNGLHVLHIRVKDADGTWSLYYRDYFYIQALSNFTSTPIVAAEYFFDSDPGTGNATSIAITEGFMIDENFAIPVPADMTDGNHYLFMRVKNMDGYWSLTKFALFQVDSNLKIADFDNSNFSVYPNPTPSFLNINFKKNRDYTIRVFDLNGKELIQVKPDGLLHTVDFSKYAKGVYLLNIIDTDSGHSSKIKIIKS